MKKELLDGDKLVLRDNIRHKRILFFTMTFLFYFLG